MDALAPVAFSGPEPLNCSSAAPPFNASAVPRPSRDDLFCYLPNFQATWGECGEGAWRAIASCIHMPCCQVGAARSHYAAQRARRILSQSEPTQHHHGAPAGNNELKWGEMWQRHGTCAEFADQTAYFAFAVAAAKKLNTDVR